jgi:hypothetical protein
MYVKVINGVISEYPYSILSLRRDNPQVSFPREMSDTLLAEYSIYKVKETPYPVITSREEVYEIPPKLINNQWVQQWEIVPAPVPQSITPRQCRLVLMAQGLLEQVEKMIAIQDEATRITWEYALEFRRDDPLLNALAKNLKLSDEQIDQFFFTASEL